MSQIHVVQLDGAATYYVWSTSCLVYQFSIDLTIARVCHNECYLFSSDIPNQFDKKQARS